MTTCGLIRKYLYRHINKSRMKKKAKKIFGTQQLYFNYTNNSFPLSTKFNIIVSDFSYPDNV